MGFVEICFVIFLSRQRVHEILFGVQISLGSQHHLWKMASVSKVN